MVMKKKSLFSFYILFKFKQMTAIYPILMLYLCEMYL